MHASVGVWLCWLCTHGLPATAEGTDASQESGAAMVQQIAGHTGEVFACRGLPAVQRHRNSHTGKALTCANNTCMNHEGSAARVQQTAVR